MLSPVPSLSPLFRSLNKPTVLAILLVVCVGRISATAANGTWLNTGAVDGSWGTASNWVGGTIPGALSGTTNADTAIFSAALGTFGTVGNPIIIDAGRNIKSLTFDTAAGNYVIGTVGGNKLLLTSTGTIQIPATLTATNAQITINAPLELQAATSTYSFTNNSANGTGAGAGTLTFGGAITGATGTSILTLTGSNTNANTISGLLSNGTGTGLAVTKSGAGTWVLAGIGNSYTGATTVSAGTLSITGSTTGNTPFTVTGGTLSLAGSIAGASSITVTGGTLTESATGVIGPAATSLTVGGTATLAGANTYTGTTAVNVGGTVQLTGTAGAIAGTSGLTVNTNGLFIDGDTTTATNNDGVTNRVKAATTLTLNGGTFQLAAGSAGTHAQSFNILASGVGLSTINTNAATGTNTLTFTASGTTNFSHAAGGLVNINTQAGFNVAFTNAPTINVVGSGADAILIGATLNNTDFVKAAAGNVGVATYTPTGTSTWAAGKNMDVTGSNGTAYTAANVNSVRFNATAANTVTLAAGTNIIQGGILVTSNVGANLTTISGGTLAGAASKDLIIVQNNTGGGLAIGSAIVNSTGTTGLTKLGNGNLTLSGLSTTAASNYTGTTILGGGTTIISGGTTASPIALTGGLTLGSSAGSTTTAILDLSNSSVTFGGAMTVQTGTATANTITVGTGQTLRVNGAVSVGFNANGANTSTALTMTGGGTFTVGAAGAPTNTTFKVAIGGSSNVGNPTTLDMSGLGTFYANLGTGTFTIGEATSGNTIVTPGSTLILPPTSTIFATTFTMDSQTQNAMTLKLGSGTNEINANNFILSSNAIGRSSGNIVFNSATGSLKLRNLAGTGRATVDLVNTTVGSGTALTGSVDLRGTGHSADLLISTLTIANRTTSTTGTPTFSFDNGIFDATTVVVASHGSAGAGTATGILNLTTTAGTNGASTIGTLTVANSAAAAFLGHATGNVNIGGGTVSVTNNVILSANTSSAAAIASGNIAISGGAVTLAGGVSMASATTGSTSTGVLTLSGGTTTLGGNITRAAAGGTENTTITLSGGTLDMGGFSIGSAAAPIGGGTGSLAWNTGTLKNLLELNGGAALVKSATGTLTLAGTNSFTGGVNFSGSGTLALGDKTALGTGTLNVTGTGNLQATTDLSGTNKVGNAVTMGGNFIINGSNNLELSGAVTSSGSNSRSLTISNTGTTTLSGNLYLAEDNTTTGRVLTLNGTGATVISGNIHNNNFGNTVAAGLTINNAAAVVTLSGTNDYTGTTTLTAGTINVNSNTAFGASPSVVLTSVTLDNTSGSARTLSNAAYTLGGNNSYTGTGGSTLDLGTGTMNLSGATRTWTVNGGTLKIGGVISGAAGFGLTKAGAGTLVLYGANSYPGATTVSGGSLLLGNGGSLGATAVAVTGATFGVTQSASGTSNSIGSTLALNAGSALTMADGFTSTLNVGTTATLAPSSGTGTSLSFDIGGATTTTDLLAITGAATVGAAKATILINGIGATPLTTGSYTIITAASGLNNNFILGSPAVIAANQLRFITLTGTATTEVINVAAATTASYWTGSQDSSWATLTDGTFSNFATDASGTVNAGAVPTGTTNVVFTATTATNLATTLDQATAVNSLVFTGSGTSNTAGTSIASGTGGTTSNLTINATASNGNIAGLGITVLAGSGANTVSAPVVLGASQTWGNYSSNALTVSGPVTGTGASLTKAGPGQLILSGLSTTAANNYTGNTIIDQGTLSIANDAALSGGLVFGAAAGSTNISILDLSTASATFAGTTTVQTNSSAVNTITIGAGEALTLNGNVTVGTDLSNSSISTVSKLTVSGAGTMYMTGTTFTLGANQVNASFTNASTMDVSSLASFNATFTTFRLGFGQTNSGTLVLSNTANNITATTIDVGNSNGLNGGTSLITLGTGTNVIQADAFNIGLSKETGTVQFASQTAGSPGTVTITNKAGSGAANITVGSNNGTSTAAVFTGTLDLRGHVANVSANTLTIGSGNNNTTTGSVTGILHFNSGNFTANNIILALKSGTGGTGTATGTINVSGGNFTVNPGGSFAMASNTAATGAATAALNLTGGTFTSNVNITKTGGTGTTATITLNGGTLDMTGRSIGDATNAIVFNAQSGTLTNLGQLNGGASLTKTTAGTLVLEGSNTYSGGTTISTGNLQVGSGGTTGTLGGGTVTNNATLNFNRSNTYTVANTITGNGAVIQSGTGTAVLTSGSNDYTGLTTVSGGALQVGSLGVGTTGTGNITVQTGATLSGTGIVQGTNFTAQSGSIVQPGNGATLSDHGTLTFRSTTIGVVTFASGSNIVLGISTPNVTDPTFGGNEIGSPGYYAYLDSFTGTGTGSHDLLAFDGPSGSSVVFSGNISVAGSSYTVQGGDIFKLLDWSATVAANFSSFNVGVNLRDGSSDNGLQLDLPDISGSGLVWDVSRFTSSGVIAVTPEPGRVLLLLLGLTGVAFRRRRTR